MRVLMVSTSYPAHARDWKGLFMRQLADALADADGVDLSLWAPPGDDDPRVTRATNAEDEVFLGRLMLDGGIAHLLRARPIAGVAASSRLLHRLRRLYVRSAADIYHVNWLQNALPLPDDRRPALVTVLGSDMRLARLPLMRTALRRVFRRRETALCPNADWMAADLATWFGDVARVAPVAFGVDARWWAIERDYTAGAPADWLVVSRLTKDKIGDLFEWAAHWFSDDERRRLHLFGPMQEDLELPGWVHYHGPATPEQLAQHWFGRACGLITLSRHSEGRPQVVLEAMASGLPVVASRLPAHCDLLRDGETGFVVDSAERLGAKLQWLECADNNVAIGAAARASVRASVGTWGDCATRYSAVYRQLSGQKGTLAP